MKNPTVDLLAIPTLLNVSFGKSLKKRNCVDVVFVNPDGKPISKKTESIIQKAGLPQMAVMPSKEVPERIIAGSNKVLLVVWVGAKEEFEEFDICALGGRVTRALFKEGFERANIHVEQDVSSKFSKAMTLKKFIHGLQTPTYRFIDLKTKPPKDPTLTDVCILNTGLGTDVCEEINNEITNLVIAEHLSRRMIDTPSDNGMQTMDAVKLARKIALRGGSRASCEVIIDEDLQETGLNALYQVGAGNPHNPAAMVILRWQGGNPDDEWDALVGKFLTHDTGGEDTKPPGEHANMKGDMGGGAMVLATFDRVVRTKAPVNLIVALAVADNRVSSTSRHPGIVMKMYKGITVEDANTDAEGRLAVGDVVRYVEEHHNPKHLVTVATLTGATIIALAHDHAALFAKTDHMIEIIKQASSQSGNPVWHMPLKESRHAKLKKGKAGEPADTTQLGDRPGGATTAAKFILCECAHTKEAAHLDVAGMAMEGFDCTGEKAVFSTGFGPGLFWETIHILQPQ